MNKTSNNLASLLEAKTTPGRVDEVGMSSTNKQQLVRELLRKRIAKVLAEGDSQASMDFAGNEVQTLFDKFKKLPASHLRKKPLDDRTCKALKVPKGSIMYQYTWGADSAAVIASQDKMVAALSPSDRAYDLGTELEKLLGIKEWHGTLHKLASDVKSYGYDDLYYFKTIAEGEAVPTEEVPQSKPVAGQYRVFHTYEVRGDLKHRSVVVKASSEEQAKQKTLNYLRSLTKIKGNQISASSIEITAVEPATVIEGDQPVSKAPSTDQAPKQKPTAAPTKPPVAKEKPRKPAEPPTVKQPDRGEEEDGAGQGDQVNAMTAALIQKIKHTVGEPEPDDIANAIISIVQAWGWDSEQKLSVLKTVRNSTVH